MVPFWRSKIMLVILMSRLRTEFGFWWCDHSENGLSPLWKCERHRLLRWCAIAGHHLCNAECMVQLDCKHWHNCHAKWPVVIIYCLLTWNPIKHNPSFKKTTIQRGKHSLDGKNWSVCRLAHFCFSCILGLTSPYPAVSQGLDYSSSLSDPLLKSDAQISRFKKTFIWSNPAIQESAFSCEWNQRIPKKNLHQRASLCRPPHWSSPAACPEIDEQTSRSCQPHPSPASVRKRTETRNNHQIIESRVTTKNTRSCELKREKPVSRCRM